MTDPLDRLVRAISRRNSFALVWAQFGLAHLLVFGGMLLLRLYQHMSDRTFWVLVIASQLVVTLDNLVSIKLTRKMWRPVRDWERGARDEASTVRAWTALATLPLTYVRRTRKYPFVFGYIPLIAFMTWELHLAWYDGFVLMAVGTVVVLAALIVRFFTIEIVCRPVLERIAEYLPPDFTVEAPGLPLRWRLLAAAPIINVITGVVVAGISTNGHHATLHDLGIAWVVAVGVSFTVSLELVVLVVRSLGSSMRDLERAVARVRAGDYTARVPLVATDETGRLAQSFNTMVEGLDERERLREAFGAYVDPDLAERVLREGSNLAGERVEVSVLFLDVRNFTAFAEQATPEEVVAELNQLWGLVVPVLLRHGGHANKFIGDGLLGVFGAPDHLPDHADRAVAAALEIASLIGGEGDLVLEAGIGINSGWVVVGTVGGGGRVEFTVIGDAVNTASRVEAATRETGDTVLISDATRALLVRQWPLSERPSMALKGKREPVTLWAADAVPPARALARDESEPALRSTS